MRGDDAFAGLQLDDHFRLNDNVGAKLAKRDALEKQKLEMFRKKNMVKIGHEQTEKTREVVTNHNLYAKKISDDAYLRRTNAAAKTSNP